METGDRLLLSQNVSFHIQHGVCYAYHNRIGYLLEMSMDVLAFLRLFENPRTLAEAADAMAGVFAREAVAEYGGLLRRYRCLVHEDIDEEQALWDLFPVRARSVCAHAPKALDAPRRVASAGAGREVRIVTLTGWRARLWDAMDGSHTLRALFEEIRRHPELGDDADPERPFLDTVAEWTDVTLQIVRLAEHSRGEIERQPHLWAPYLDSVMRYPALDEHSAVTVPLHQRVRFSPLAYREEIGAPARPLLDSRRASLSYLFRRPHPALDGETYGQRFAAGLQRHASLPSPVRDVVELSDVPSRLGPTIVPLLRELQGQSGADIRYRGLAPRRPEGWGDEPRDQDEGWPVERIEPDDLCLEPESVDLFLCDEFAGALEVLRLTRANLGLTADLFAASGLPRHPDYGQQLADGLEHHGQHGARVLRYGLPLDDAPLEFYLNSGVFGLLEELWRALRPGGVALITEFGDDHYFPQVATHEDHPRVSIHFGHVKHVARKLGFGAEYLFGVDFLRFDATVETLSVGRTDFAALHDLAATFGCHLEHLPYTREMLEEALAPQVALDELQGLSFEAVDRACLGTIPSLLKVLVLSKPTAAERTDERG